MRNLKVISIYLLSGIMLASCGASKKLETANAQIASLNGQVETLNAKVATSEKEISQLSVWQRGRRLPQSKGCHCPAIRQYQ
jgi:outer membrane murein-binding lipoprotein Lpp